MALIAHSGAHVASLEEVRRVLTPRPTQTHYPIPHGDVVDLIQRSMAHVGYEIVKAEYALRNGVDSRTKQPIPGAQLFGLLNLRNGHNAGDYSLIAGFRNSHDKTIPAGIALGSRVLVCDNMAFSGEVVFGRKHTRFIMGDLPSIIQTAVGRLGDLRVSQDRRITAYKGRELSDRDAYAGIIHMLKADILPASKIGKVVEEWDRRGERHAEFAPRNAWSLFNAATEVLKDYPIDGPGADGYQSRTMRLHALMDLACRVTLKDASIPAQAN